MSTKEYFDLIVIVPLEEEMQEVVRHFPQLEDRSTSETFACVVDCGNPELRVLLVQQELEGKSYAQKAVSDALQIHDAGLIVCLGIAGNLTDDLKLGDVVYSGQIIDVVDNSKASEHDGEIDLSFSTEQYETPREFTNAANLVRVVAELKPLHEKWVRERGLEAKVMVPDPYPGRGDVAEISGPPASKNGKIVCAAVSKSPKYNQKLEAIDRKFLAIETESGGIFSAAKRHRLPAITIRGLSDHADKQKTKLEKQTGGSLRRIAVGNAATFLKMQLQNRRFVTVLKSRRHVVVPLAEQQTRLKSTADDLTSIIIDAQTVVADQLRDLYPEFRYSDKEYHLPVPRVTKKFEVRPVESAPKYKEHDVVEMLDGLKTIIIELPRSYPDAALPWVIADAILAASVTDRQFIPVHLDAAKLRSTSKGLEAISDLNLLSRCLEIEAAIPVLLIEVDFARAHGRTRLLLTELTKYPELPTILFCKEEGNAVAIEELRARTGADVFSLCNISFLEMATFIQNAFGMTVPEAEVVAFRLRQTFEQFDLSAHPAYVAGIPKQMLFKILEANGRAELIGLAVEGFLLLLVADDDASIRVNKSRRAEFLRELATKLNVEKHTFNQEELVAFVKIFAARFDYEIDPLAFIQSYCSKGILHFEADTIRFSLPFIERYSLAIELASNPPLAEQYFQIQNDDFDYHTFEIYAEIKPSREIIKKILNAINNEVEVANRNLGDTPHILMTDKIRPVLLTDQVRLARIQNRLKSLAAEVHSGKGNLAEKQSILDLAYTLRKDAERRTADAATGNLETSEVRDKLNSLAQVLSIGTILLGAGAESLEATDKRALSKALITVAAYMMHVWTGEYAKIDFAAMKKAILTEEFFTTLKDRFNGDSSPPAFEEAKLLFSGVFDVIELGLLGFPLRSILGFLCERAHSKVLAASLEKASFSSGVQGLIYAAWLSDMEASRGREPLNNVLRHLPALRFLRIQLASHLMTRVYWHHWEVADRRLLLEAAEEAIKPFMTIGSKAEILRDLAAEEQKASSSSRRGNRPSKQEKRRRRSQRRRR